MLLHFWCYGCVAKAEKTATATAATTATATGAAAATASDDDAAIRHAAASHYSINAAAAAVWASKFW